MGNRNNGGGGKLICSNSKARHDYFIEDCFEAGIALTGTEVKSLRLGKANLRDSYAALKQGEIFLVHCHISEYSHGNIFNHDPLRERRLLLHKREILKLGQKVRERGYTIIPLKLYFKESRVKVELALAKGKHDYDKRESLKQDEAKREMDHARKNFGRE